MTVSTRLALALLLAGGWMTGFVLAQGPAAAPPQTPGQAANEPDQPPGPPVGARGRQGGGGRRGGFAQFTRPLAPQDVLVRGQALYETNCASCHASDLRGGPDGTNLLRSGTALRDQQGELVTAAIAAHTPPILLVEADSVAIAEYIHSVHATMGGQGSPPGRNPTDITLDILVGDPATGQVAFDALCGSCHSVTGDLSRIGSRFTDPRMLQNAWVAGSTTAFGRGGRGGGGGSDLPATVTMADGSTLEGTLARVDDFLVVLMLPDGTRRTIARTNGVPSVEVHDPMEGHKSAILTLAFEDSDNSQLHGITAYLWSIK